MKLPDIHPVVYNAAEFTSCEATPNNEAYKSTYCYRLMYMKTGMSKLLFRSSIAGFKAGDILFLPPGEKYRVLNAFGDFTVVNVFFDFTQTEGSQNPTSHVLVTDFNPSMCGLPIELEDGLYSVAELFHRTRLGDQIVEIEREFHGFARYRDEYLSVLMKKLLMRLPFAANELAAQAVEFADYIDEHIGEELSLEQLSAHFDYHPNQINRIMRALTGHSAHDYVLTRKTERARTLLTETGLSITEIAQLLGFSDASHFSKTFKKYAGLPPSVYRK